jgi:hypothetical protein
MPSALYMIVYTLRVCHIFEHDIADLECWFAESQLQQFDRSYLSSVMNRVLNLLLGQHHNP